MASLVLATARCHVPSHWEGAGIDEEGTKRAARYATNGAAVTAGLPISAQPWSLPHPKSTLLKSASRAMTMTFDPEDVIHTKERKAFRVLSHLGTGGMSEVYRATDHSMSRTVVFKMLARPALKHAGRFIQEAKMLANVSHANVARVYERGETNDGFPYYTMEDLDAWSLREILVTRAKEKKYGVTWEVALNITSQILFGLGALHDAGIVHRDVKPENVLLAKQRSGQQIIKIIDPGIAKLLDDDRHEGFVATPMYAAPEQLASTAALPIPQTDIFSAGLVLYELLTGRYAYSVYGFDLGGAIERSNKPVFAPSMLRAELPPAVDALVGLMTQLDPNKRPTALIAMRMAEEIGLAQDAANQMRGGRVGAPVITESGLRQQPRREARITRADLEAPTDPDGAEVSPNLRYMQMLAEQAIALGYDPVPYVQKHTKGISPEELDRRYLLGVKATSPDDPESSSASGAPAQSLVVAPGYLFETLATSQAKDVAEAPPYVAAAQVDRSAPTRSAKIVMPMVADTPVMSLQSEAKARADLRISLPAAGKGGTVPMRAAFRAEDFPPEPSAASRAAGTVPMRRPFGSDPSERAGVVMQPVDTKPSQARAARWRELRRPSWRTRW